MLGKNTRQYPTQRKERRSASKIVSGERKETIPPKVGNEISAFTFADESLDQTLIQDCLKFARIAKHVLIPLESCFDFPSQPRAHFMALSLDAVYLHAAVSSVQLFSDLTSGGTNPRANHLSVKHYGITLRLLQERVAKGSSVSDTTVMVVLWLWTHAHAFGEHDAAMQHIRALRRIVDLRGGLGSFAHRPKLAIELLRADLVSAMHSGPEHLTFFTDPFREPIWPYPNAPCAAQVVLPACLEGLSACLVAVFEALKRFCIQVNTVALAGERLPETVLLHAMVSIMYRLATLRFPNDSLDEICRLAALSFCASAFTSWQHVQLEYPHFRHAFLPCLAGVNRAEIPPNLAIWLVLSVAVSDLVDPRDLFFLLASAIGGIGLEKWQDVSYILQQFPWIDAIHDRPAQRFLLLAGVIKEDFGSRDALI